MKRFLLTIIIFTVISIQVYSLTGEYGVYTGEGTILIAYENTRFKEKFIESLLEKLEAEGFYIIVVDHQDGGLEGLSAEDYDLVFITNSGAKAQVRPVVVDWLNANGGNPPNVFVHTTQRTVWEPLIEVDGITSASLRRNDEIGELADEVLETIKAMISEQ